MNPSIRLFVLVGLLVLVHVDLSAQKMRWPFVDGCETSGSYTALWMKQSRYKAESFESRRTAATAMTREQLERISDGDFFPSMFQTCGMGLFEGLAKVRKDGKVGFINRSGKVVIPLKFSDATRFSEGLAGVELENGKWGFIDRYGKLVLRAKYDWALRFKEGRALVQIGEKWGFIDRNGRLVVPAKYGHAYSFSEGLAAVQIAGLDPISKIEDSWMTGYIDKAGKLAIEHKFGGNGSFVGGKAMVDMGVTFPDKPGYYYACFLIDRSGNIISDELESCDEQHPSETSHLEFISDNEYRSGYRLRNGKIIWKLSK